MAGWNAETAAGPLGPGAVTLVEGTSFCISSPNGDIHTEHPHGVFFQDTRILSRWVLSVNEQPLEALAAETKEPYRALFVTRAARAGGEADSSLLVERVREVGVGIIERITIRNYSRQVAECTLLLTAESDFADLFDVKEARTPRVWNEIRMADDDSLTIRASYEKAHRGILVAGEGAHAFRKGLSYKISVPAHGVWTTQLRVEPLIDGVFLSHKARGADAPSPSDLRHQLWAEKIPALRVENPSIERTLRQSYEDLGALRIEDPSHPERVVVAAGAPWFMALFGRDSLWASIMALPVDPSLALGTLQTLADRQGEEVNPATEEEPGKILHEVRLDVSSNLALGGKSTYYGSVDATPLFVMVLGILSRWGFSPETIRSLLPHADRALTWIRDYGDKDGDGFVEYQRLNPAGLVNQGWKDSWDGINFADGTVAEPPIALCEVQAYVYNAYLARAWIAYDEGEETLASSLANHASQIKAEFNDKFWMPRHGYYAVALDGHKRQVDAITSNVGHCMWLGLIDDDKAAQVVDRLMSPEMFTGWGVRTLASDMGAYNPASYHNGSVWPHDNAILVAGLLRYGFVEEAQKLAVSLLEAAELTGGRLPELFCGFEREQFSAPIPYPTACSPQAWAATTPIQLMTSLLGYDVHVSRGGLWMDPVLPDSFGKLHVTNAPAAGGRVTVDACGSQATVSGLPPGMTFHRGHRPWMSELVGEVRRGLHP